MTSKLFVVSTVLFAFLFIIPISAVKAADSDVVGVIISPPVIEKQVAAGDVINDVIKVTNPNSSSNLEVAVSVEDFKAKGEEGQQDFIDPATSSNGFSLGSWITTEKSFILNANESKEIKYTVTVPQDAEPGGHYGVIFFSPKLVNEATASSGSGVVAIPKIGSLILLTTPGDIKYSANIIQFNTDKKLYLNIENAINMLTRFQNLGTTHVKPQGNITIKNMLGKQVASLPVNDKLGNVLPDSIRKFENDWAKKYGFGLYRAEVNLVYNDGKTATAASSFWILPWMLIVIIIVVILILIWISRNLHWGGNSKPLKVTETKETL